MTLIRKRFYEVFGPGISSGFGWPCMCTMISIGNRFIWWKTDLDATSSGQRRPEKVPRRGVISKKITARFNGASAFVGIIITHSIMRLRQLFWEIRSNLDGKKELAATQNMSDNKRRARRNLERDIIKLSLLCWGRKRSGGGEANALTRSSSNDLRP